MKQDFSHIIQIGVVVPDVDAAAEQLNRLLGWVPAQELETMHIPGRFYRGKPEDFACRMLFYRFSNIELEMIQPLQGNSCWSDFLTSAGRGIHHLLFDLVSSDESIAELSQRGIEIEQRGRALPYGENVFWAYVCSADPLGFTMELTNRREYPKDQPSQSTIYGPFARLSGVEVITKNLERTIQVWKKVLDWSPDNAPYRIFGDIYQGNESGSLSGAVTYRLPNLEIELVRPVFGASCAQKQLSSFDGGICCMNIEIESIDLLQQLTLQGVSILERGHTLQDKRLTRWVILDSLALFGFYLKLIFH